MSRAPLKLVACLTLAAISLGASDCESAYEPPKLQACKVTRRKGGLGEARSKLFAGLAKRWMQPVIPVCWEDRTFDEGFSVEREWVRESVEQSWQAALAMPEVPEDSRIRFTGWQRCGVSGGAGIRIAIRDEGPFARKLGSDLAGFEEGIVMNFTFTNWSTFSCLLPWDRENCVRGVAVHEFGHALGFAHEQNRRDTPVTCTDAPQGVDGDTYLGAWDLDSVMNYCNPVWAGAGQLSPGDIEGARAAYYPWLYEFDCEELAPESPDGPGGSP